VCECSAQKDRRAVRFRGLCERGNDPTLRETLREAGYAVGTAYQLADDILDVNGNTESAGKTLGRDEARKKTTAARVRIPDDTVPAQFIERLCDQAGDSLSPWPAVRKAWTLFMAHDMKPALDHNLGLARVPR